MNIIPDCSKIICWIMAWQCKYKALKGRRIYTWKDLEMFLGFLWNKYIRCCFCASDTGAKPRALTLPSAIQWLGFSPRFFWVVRECFIAFINSSLVPWRGQSGISTCCVCNWGQLSGWPASSSQMGKHVNSLLDRPHRAVILPPCCVYLAKSS